MVVRCLSMMQLSGGALAVKGGGLKVGFDCLAVLFKFWLLFLWPLSVEEVPASGPLCWAAMEARGEVLALRVDEGRLGAQVEQSGFDLGGSEETPLCLGARVTTEAQVASGVAPGFLS